MRVLLSQIEPWVLWEGTQYRVIADAFPRVPGHILLITRSHVLHHADAPPTWWSELEGATDRLRDFLLTTCGAASFWENGYPGKEVPHAHLHGMPVHFNVAPEWVSEGKLLSMKDWIDVRRHRDHVAGYAFIAGAGGRYLALDRPFVLAALRQAVTRQTSQTLDCRLSDDIQQAVDVADCIDQTSRATRDSSVRSDQIVGFVRASRCIRCGTSTSPRRAMSAAAVLTCGQGSIFDGGETPHCCR